MSAARHTLSNRNTEEVLVHVGPQINLATHSATFSLSHITAVSLTCPWGWRRKEKTLTYTETQCISRAEGQSRAGAPEHMEREQERERTTEGLDQCMEGKSQTLMDMLCHLPHRYWWLGYISLLFLTLCGFISSATVRDLHMSSSSPNKCPTKDKPTLFRSRKKN